MAMRVKCPKAMQRKSPAVGFMPAARSWARSSRMMASSPSSITEKTVSPELSLGAADEHGIDNGGAGAVDMDRAAHLGRAWKSRRTDQARIEDGDADGVISLDAVVVKGEGKRRAWLQALAPWRGRRLPVRR